MEKEQKGRDYLTEAIRLIIEENENYHKILYLLDKALVHDLCKVDRAMAHACKGGIYLREGRLEEAEAELKNALRLDETFGDNPLMLVQTWQELAIIHEERGDVDGAAKCLQKGIEQLQVLFNSDEVKRLIMDLYFFLADLYLRHRYLESNSLVKHTFLALKRLIEKDPDFPKERLDDYPETFFVLGALHSTKEIESFYNPKKALEYYERYLTLIHSSDVPIYYHSDLHKHEVRKAISLEKLKTLRKE